MPGPVPTIAELSAHEHAAWQAVRLRLASADPWLQTALYRVTPVSLTPGQPDLEDLDDVDAEGLGNDEDGLGAQFRADLAADARKSFRQVPVTADRWGRIYVDFSLEQSAGIETLATQVRTVLRGWLDGTAADADWHADLSDERFPTAEHADTERIARTTARQLLAQPTPTRRQREQDADWHGFAERLAGPPQLSWQQTLGGLMRASIAASSGKSDYTYSRPGRRTSPGMFVRPDLHAG